MAWTPSAQAGGELACEGLRLLGAGTRAFMVQVCVLQLGTKHAELASKSNELFSMVVSEDARYHTLRPLQPTDFCGFMLPTVDVIKCTQPAPKGML